MGEDHSRLTESEIDAILLDEQVGYLALARDNQPYLIPLNFLYEKGSIYFHCALQGRKIDYIRANPRACFQTGEAGGLISGDSPCSHNYSYQSVIVEGVVEEVVDTTEKENILRLITAKYSTAQMAEGMISASRISATGVYRIIPSNISGKRDT
ncbi:MAG: pyridoxamine 5'-phosphate oxidase family protein [Firmicutes bacterium]|nr:pyridoxamine 5'-phosphate oxidase family protein [Bacillota bacterium]